MITKLTKRILKKSPQNLRLFSAEFIPLTTANRINRNEYTDIFNAILGATSCEDIARRLNQAEGSLDDKMVSYALEKVQEENYGLDAGFHNGLIPFITKHLRAFTLQNNQAFTDIVINAGLLGVTDADFWRAVKEVMVIQRMYRYIPLEQMGEVIKSFAVVGQADGKILELLGNQVIKHKRFLPERTKSDARQGFQIAEIGFAEFKRALEEDEVFELDLVKE